MNGLQLPSWIVPLAGLAAAVWAIAMWWMVATMPTSGASEAELDLIVASAEIDRLEISVDELAQQVAALHQQRSELSLRLETLEQAPVASVAVQTTQPIAPVAGPPSASDSGDAAAGADADKQDDEDEDAQGESTPPPDRSESTPTATATAAAPEPPVIIKPTATPAAVQYFTDGRDRYNCKDFDSWEEAQTAYEANLPGDPNKIDIDRNGIACEALR